MIKSTNLKAFFISGRDFAGEKSRTSKIIKKVSPSKDSTKQVISDSNSNYDFNPQEIMNILSSINRNYFVNSSSYLFFRFELDNISESEINGIVLINRIKQLENQRFVVEREISRLIQSNHNDYMEEIARLTNIQSSLKSACNHCQQSRILLNNALIGIKTGGLGILLSFKKKERLKSLLKQLSMIRTLQRADLWLNERLNHGNYKEAAHCCMIILKALNSFQFYSSCIDLASKLLDIQRNIIIKLDENLHSLCQNFDSVKYNDLMGAYNALCIGESAIDKIVLFFISKSKKTYLKIMITFCNSHSPKKIFSFQDDLNITDIVTYIQSNFVTEFLEDFTKSVISLSYTFSEILFLFTDICSHHESCPELFSSDYFVSQTLVATKFRQGKVLLWIETEKMLISLLNVTKLESLNFDNLIHLIEIIKFYIRMGSSFCDNVSSSLQDTIHELVLCYFKNFHSLRMDELKLFLENESWEFCPLPGNFNLEQLQEFDFLEFKDSMNSPEEKLFSMQSFLQSPSFVFDFVNLEDRIKMLNFFKQETLSTKEHSNNFESTNQEPLENQSQPYNHSHKLSNSTSHDILISNTTLIALKFIGRYVKLMHVLNPIALDIFQYLTQIYKFYFYAVYMYFAHKNSFRSENSIVDFFGTESHDSYFSSKLKFVVSNIGTELSLAEEVFSASNVSKILLESVDLFGLRYRIIGVESLLFLSEQLYTLRPTIESLLRNTTGSNVDNLSTFYTQYIQLSYGLRRPIYCGLARFVISYDQIFTKMLSTKWDFREFSSEHNSYVESIIKEFERVSSSISQLSKHIPTPQLAKNMIFTECSSLINKLLVEGFAAAKKCTHHGRALMLLDFRQYVAEVERLCQIKVQQKNFVEDYIHAFYLDDEELDRWILEHKEYSASQLNMLVNCKTSFTKRTTTKLLSLIDKGTPHH